MKSTILFLLALLIIPMILFSAPWGFFAHKKINQLAIYSVPPPFNIFLKKHSLLLQEYAVLPDERRYIMEEEAQRHYIDLDHYDLTKIKFMNLKEAESKYNKDSLSAHGIVVWHIPIAYEKLKFALAEKNIEKIIKYAAELGHYVADAHVPLHTTSNYDGQKTGQTGIHSFWESRIPEILNQDLEEWLGQAKYISNVQQEAWEYVLGSNVLVNKLLESEKKLSNKTAASKKYTFEQKGKTLIKTYSKEYSLAYHKLLNRSIENRFSAAVLAVSSLWYSAWLEAGQPNLN